MTDTLKDVLQGTKRIEAILEEKFGSTGRGLYEKIDTANMKLPEPLQKRIRYVATLRNKAMHQEGFEIDNIPDVCQNVSGDCGTAGTLTCQSQTQGLRSRHQWRLDAKSRIVRLWRRWYLRPGIPWDGYGSKV